MNLTKIDPTKLNSRQKENYNYNKVSAVLADYGFNTLRLSDDWQGADFIAVHIDGETFRKVQLKSRMGFYKKYIGKNIDIVFPNATDWYLYPHDELLNDILQITNIENTTSWEKGEYHFPRLSEQLLRLLEPYKIGSPADNPTPVPLPE